MFRPPVVIIFRQVYSTTSRHNTTTSAKKVSPHTHSISTRNSAHVMLSIFYILTQFLNFFFKLNILYL